jgi:hypothetical protein
MAKTRARKAASPCTCRWKGCREQSVKQGVFCSAHSQAPPAQQLPEWIRRLPTAIGAGLASRALYDMLTYFAQHVHFSDTAAEKVEGMRARLKLLEGEQLVIEEVARFIEAGAPDPGISRDMTVALARLRS